MPLKFGVHFFRKASIGICGEHGGDPTSATFCHSLGLQSSDRKVSPAGSGTSGSDSPPDCHSMPSVSLRYLQQLRQLLRTN